jgi:hypothetical protein
MDIAKLCTVPSTSPSASIGLARILNKADDYSVIFENSITDETLFQCPQKLSETTDVPLRNSLYSTPLSWKRPQPGCQVGNPNSCALPSSEESKLRCIAMPAQPCLASPVSSPPLEPQDKPNCRKRKLSESSQSDILPLPRSRQSAPDKIAHSMVEKRYRASINNKIAMLRDSVPSLRVIDKHNLCGGDFTEDLQGLPLVQKLNKVFIHLHPF